MRSGSLAGEKKPESFMITPNKKKESSTPARPVAAPKLGGGKLRSVQNRTRRAAASPYPKQNKPPKKEASMGEAQLFLKLWKL